MIDNQLLDSWDIHNRMLLYLFDSIEPDGFAGKPQGMSGRSVGSILAHMHNVRLSWIEVSVPALMYALERIPTRAIADHELLTPELLRPALEQSAEAVRDLLYTGFATGKLKNLKPHLVGNFGYFIAHEWYHIGEICMTLTQSGHRLDDKVLYNIWTWDRWHPIPNQLERINHV